MSGFEGVQILVEHNVWEDPCVSIAPHIVLAVFFLELLLFSSFRRSRIQPRFMQPFVNARLCSCRILLQTLCSPFVSVVVSPSFPILCASDVEFGGFTLLCDFDNIHPARRAVIASQIVWRTDWI